MQDHIIRKLGGAKVVGDALRARGVRIEDVTVRSWTLAGRNIPARYWVHIQAIAQANGQSFSIEDAANQAAADVFDFCDHVDGNTAACQQPSAGKSENNTAQRVAA